VGRVVDKQVELLPKAFFEGREVDDVLAAVLAAEGEKLVELLSRPLGPVLGQNLTFERDELLWRGGSLIANLLAASLREETNADFGMVTGGFVRSGLGAGRTTYGDLYEVMPFGNTVGVTEISGFELVSLLAQGTRHYPTPEKCMPHMSGIRYTLNLSADPAEPVKRITSAIRLSATGESLGPLDLEAKYVLACTDFLKGGGDDYSVLRALPKFSHWGTDFDEVVDGATPIARRV
jgi:2',3'-cyclic-nucleotide 2'-phosphodiesterase (5'-nucleotidase family)